MSYRTKELAARLAPDASPKEIQQIVRQIRHWSLCQILPTEDGVHVGTGTRRSYDETAAQVAAIFLALAPFNLPVGTLARAALGFQMARAAKPEILRGAIEGTENISMAFTRDGTTPVLYPSEGPLPIAHYKAVIVLNLAKIFEPLRR